MKSMSAGMTFYSDSIIEYQIGKKTFSTTFLNDTTLPDNVKKLQFILKVDNPNEIDYVIWAIERRSTGDTFGTTSEMKHTSKLPTEVIHIDMPTNLKPGHIVWFHVEAYARNYGSVLYKSAPIKYRK